jgi:hypothetical protein
MDYGNVTALTQGEVDPAMSGEGTREEADPQLTCLLMEAPRGQQDPPHGEADRAYKTAPLSDSSWLTKLYKRQEKHFSRKLKFSLKWLANQTLNR